MTWESNRLDRPPDQQRIPNEFLYIFGSFVNWEEAVCIYKIMFLATSSSRHFRNISCSRCTIPQRSALVAESSYLGEARLMQGQLSLAAVPTIFYARCASVSPRSATQRLLVVMSISARNAKDGGWTGERDLLVHVGYETVLPVGSVHLHATADARACSVRSPDRE